MEEMVQWRISAESDMSCYMMRVRAGVPRSEEGSQWSFLEELGPGLRPEDDGVTSVSTTFPGSPPLSFLPSFRTGRSDSEPPRTPPSHPGSPFEARIQVLSWDKAPGSWPAEPWRLSHSDQGPLVTLRLFVQMCSIC